MLRKTHLVVALLIIAVVWGFILGFTDLELRSDLIEHTPSIYPTWGIITSYFGEWRGDHMHMGIDIANRRGTPIYATASGTIVFADRHGGMGKEIRIYHGLGLNGHDYTTVYGHLDRIYVKQWDKVKQGEFIGTMGNTGNSTGPHLHYEVLVDGINVSPRFYLP